MPVSWLEIPSDEELQCSPGFESTSVVLRCSLETLNSKEHIVKGQTRYRRFRGRNYIKIPGEDQERCLFGTNLVPRKFIEFLQLLYPIADNLNPSSVHYRYNAIRNFVTEAATILGSNDFANLTTCLQKHKDARPLDTESQLLFDVYKYCFDKPLDSTSTTMHIELESKLPVCDVCSFHFLQFAASQLTGLPIGMIHVSVKLSHVSIRTDNHLYCLWDASDGHKKTTATMLY